MKPTKTSLIASIKQIIANNSFFNGIERRLEHIHKGGFIKVRYQKHVYGDIDIILLNYEMLSIEQLQSLLDDLE